MNQESLFRIGKALIYAIIAAGGVIQAGGAPKTAEGWIGLVITSIVAGWGKYSSSTTLIAPNRTPWTNQERIEHVGG
jgi:hypothetical protein